MLLDARQAAWQPCCRILTIYVILKAAPLSLLAPVAGPLCSICQHQAGYSPASVGTKRQLLLVSLLRPHASQEAATPGPEAQGCSIASKETWTHGILVAHPIAAVAAGKSAACTSVEEMLRLFSFEPIRQHEVACHLLVPKRAAAAAPKR